MIIKRIAILATIIITICCCTEKYESLSETRLYNRTYSLLCERNDSVISHISQIKQQKNKYENAQACADYFVALYYRTHFNIDSLNKYTSKAIDEMSQFKGQDIKPNADLCIAEMKLIKGYIELEYNNNNGLARQYIEESFETFEQKKQTLRLIECNIYLSKIKILEDDFTASLTHLQKIESLYDDLNLDSLQADTKVTLLSNIAATATNLGYYTLADNYLNIASAVFDKISDEVKAEYLYQRALVQLHKNEYTLVDYTSHRIENTAKKIGSKDMLWRSYVMMGLALSRMDLNDDAMIYQHKADSLYRNGKNIREINEKHLLDGELAAKSNLLDSAYTLLFDSAFTNHYIYHINTLLESQKTYYLVQHNFQKAYEIDKRQKDNLVLSAQYMITADEHFKVANAHDINNLQQRLKTKEKSIAEIESSHNHERIIFSLILTIIIVLIAIYKRKETKRNKNKVEKEFGKLKNEIDEKVKELEHQKEILQQCNTRIAESISYADRIQHSIMPYPEQLNQYPITGSFIFHSPLDVVSGDFYWFTKKDDYLIVCCADCTGHGVPGAFMSMIASTILNDICNKSAANIAPSEILRQLDAKLIENLAHNRTESGASKDGLDISIVSIDLKTKKVTTSAARRPVIIIKDQEIIHIVGTKRSIGDTEEILRSRDFDDTEIQLHTNDVIYMYTDGYSDQFGGNDGAKMKNKKISKFLRAIHDDDMDEQCLTVQELFTQWKGDYPQTDDVLFIGLKL